MSNVPRIQATSTRAVVEAAARHGVDRGQLLRDHQLAESTLADPDSRLPVNQVNALWLDAMSRSGQPDLPVIAAIELPWGAYRVIDYLCANSKSLGEGMAQLSRVFRIVNDTVRIPVELDEAGGATVRIERPDGGVIPSMYVDYALTACLFRFRYVTGVEVHPIVRLRRKAPANIEPHHRAFGPRVLFEQERDEAAFDAALWSTPSLAPDPILLEVLHQHATRILADLPTVDPLVDQVREALKSGLPHGHFELGRVAKTLGTSPRTLQRKLTAKGLRWREIVEETRFALARGHLVEKALSVEEVGLLVGYSDHSSFNRAFTRWTDQTPGMWRRTH